MKYYLMIRSRPRPDDPIPQAHDRAMSQLKQLPPPWGLTCDPWPKAKDPKDYAEVVILRKCFGPSITMTAKYQHRAALDDEDDWFRVDFFSKKVDYAMLLDSALPAYIGIMRAYRAQLMPEDFLLNEANNIRDVPYRTGVYNIAPANFFDRELCQQAFQLTPQQVLDRLQGKIAEGRIINDGAYVLATREILDLEQTRQLNASLKPLLTS